VLYLFGTPGQERFWFMWDDLSYGALGAVVLVDTRRLIDCFAAVDYFEQRETPFILGINCFDGALLHKPEDVRIALDLGSHIPVLPCDVRDKESVKELLVALVRYVIAEKDSATTGALLPHR
jgi:signal recognition particle receptor subunit beta